MLRGDYSYLKLSRAERRTENDFWPNPCPLCRCEYPRTKGCVTAGNRCGRQGDRMAPGREAGKRELGVKPGLTQRARSVVRAFMEARNVAPGFVLSCGVLPEVSESVTERLHRVIHYLAGRRFERERHARALRAAIRDVTRSEDAVDRVETRLTALTAADTTAAYVFGLAVGLALGSLPSRLRL